MSVAGRRLTRIAVFVLHCLVYLEPALDFSVVPNTNMGPGEIFRTDFTGDGTVQDYPRNPRGEL
jgi:hypothetical protein